MSKQENFDHEIEGFGYPLSDAEILEYLVDIDPKKRIIITPLIDCSSQLGPTSIDLHLGTEFLVTDRSSNTHFDPLWDRERLALFERSTRAVKRISPSRPFVIHSKQFAVATTLEYLELPRNIVGRLDGRSTWARHGIQVHCTASIIHPGSKGIIAYELQNMEDIPMKLYPGMKLAQLSFFKLRGHPLQAYDQKQKPKFLGHINPHKISLEP